MFRFICLTGGLQYRNQGDGGYTKHSNNGNDNH